MQDQISGFYDERIAKIVLNEHAEQLQISRAVSEFTVEIPATVKFFSMPEKYGHLRPSLGNLWGDVFTKDSQNKAHLVGKVSQPDFKHNYYPNNEVATGIKWRGSLPQLACFEKIRGGNTPNIQLNIWIEYYYLIDTDIHPAPPLRTESRNSWLNYSLELSKELWVDRLRKIDFLENILIEIPLPSSPNSPWDEVWKAMVDAREAFEKGGTTAWKDCIVSCRLALEEWQKIEKEDMGAGWKSPSPVDRQLRTKEQRLDNIRWHLLQLAHYSAHTHADRWAREDALIMLSTLSALLVERNP